LEDGNALRLKRSGGVQIEQGNELFAVLDGDEGVTAFPHQAPVEEGHLVLNPQGSESGERLEAQALANEKRGLFGVDGEDGTGPRPEVGNEIGQSLVCGLPGIIRDQQCGEPIDVAHIHLT
jgi:hypothetical protein